MNDVTTLNTCCNAHGELPVEQGRQVILQQLEVVSTTEFVSVRQVAGRVLAEDIDSPVDVPGYDNSAMDGYALRFADLNDSEQTSLALAGQALAGHPFFGAVAAGNAVRIMTGAMMPDGTDTVVMQEIVTLEGDLEGSGVIIPTGIKKGQNRRFAGEDIAKGSVVLKAGVLIQAAEQGLLASLGLGEVPVKRRLKVAVLSTGDEVCLPGEKISKGQIFDSNRFSLLGLLASLDVEVVDLGIIADQPALLEQAFSKAANEADLVLTSGGVSVGDADYVKETLERIGEIHFWKMAMKPGRPLAYGRIDSAVFFGLPGNPVAVMVTFLQFVLPAIKKMQGIKDWQPMTLPATSTCALNKRAGRTEFQRGIFNYSEDGRLLVTISGTQGSGVLSSMSRANCLIVLTDDESDVQEGDQVKIQPLIL